MSRLFAGQHIANRRHSPRKSARLPASSFHRPLRFEPLEDRRLLALITVDTLLDENDGIGVGNISLRDALADADPTDVIEFDVAGTITLTHGELVVDRSLSITGPGANLLTIDARSASRVFNVDDGNAGTPINVAISGLTITGGNTGADGGGILNRDALIVTACNITGNAAEDGGGIGNFSGTLTIVDTTIANNTAFGVNGGGAGIFNFGSSKSQTTTITSSTISSNTTTTAGGGIYNFQGTILLSHSTVTKNDAPANQGSGIASWGDTNVAETQVGSTIIAGNLHSDVDIIVGFQPTFQSTGYNLIGFGNSTGSFTFTGDQRNVADPLLGPLTDNGGPTPTHLPLVGSSAIDTGDPTFFPPSGVWDQRGLPHPRVFDGNSDSVNRVDKGAVERDVVTFQVDTLTDDNDANFSAGDFSLREAIGQASLVVIGTPTIVFAPSLFAGGPAQSQLLLGQLAVAKRMNIEGPGASLLTIDAFHDFRVVNVDDDVAQQIEVKISGLTIANGRSVMGGGGVFSDERLTLADCVISGSKAQWGGGLYNAEHGNLLVLRTRITGNSADVQDDNSGEGGGFYNWGGTAKFVECTITGNTAPNGAGLSNANFGNLSIEGCSISGNTAELLGGGVDTDSGNLAFRSSTISGNHAERGGGVHINTAPFLESTISNSTISGNVAPSGGGGIDNYQGHAIIEFCTITQNVSNNFAGSGVRSGDAPVATTEFYSCIIAANLDPNGGGQTAPYDVAVSGGANTLFSHGYNIVGIGGFLVDTFSQTGDQRDVTDPKLGPLADNGGPTLTHSVLADSPALDHGDPSSTSLIASAPAYDQRGKPFARIRDGDPPASIVMDVGAFEAQSLPAALPGDYDLNGTVETADYVVWRNTLNSSVLAYSSADGNGNGVVDQPDYSLWRSQFGKTLSLASATGTSVEELTTEVSSLANQPLALPGVGVATIAEFSNVAATVQPAHSEAQFALSPSLTIARQDIALLAWLASRSGADREFDGGTFHNTVGDESERARDDELNPVTVDAALAAICSDV